MRSNDSTRPAHLAAVPDPGQGPRASAVRRDCRAGCGWSVVSTSRTTAQLEAATHRVEHHTTDQGRALVARAVAGWEEVFAGIGQDLPRHLLPGIVDPALALGQDQAASAVVFGGVAA